MKKNFIFSLFIPLLWLACKKEIAPITFSKQNIKQEAPFKDSLSSFKVEINYLVAQGATPEVAKSINDTLQNEIAMNLLSMSDDTIFQKMDINSALQKFRTSYDNMLKEQDGIPASERFSLNYEVEMDFKEMSRNEKVVCVAGSNYFFTGGAHPNGFTSYYVFDSQTGKTFFLENLIKEKEKAKMIELLEKEVRKVLELKPNASLEEEGLFVDETTKKIPLPLNFALSEDKKGISFIYNPYEIAAYAFGPIAFTVPFGELEGLMNLEKIK
jgi:hypothetical protein